MVFLAVNNRIQNPHPLTARDFPSPLVFESFILSALAKKSSPGHSLRQRYQIEPDKNLLEKEKSFCGAPGTTCQKYYCIWTTRLKTKTSVWQPHFEKGYFWLPLTWGFFLLGRIFAASGVMLKKYWIFLPLFYGLRHNLFVEFSIFLFNVLKRNNRTIIVKLLFWRLFLHWPQVNANSFYTGTYYTDTYLLI